MSVRFIHSADWQLGVKFARFGKHADRLRAARLATLESTLALATDRDADFMLIAGDMFEGNLVEDLLVRQVLALFAAQPNLPVFILPGNHDPASGPDSIWEREVFGKTPSHVQVFRKAAKVELAGGWLLASPLVQKNSHHDPSCKLDELAADIPANAIKVGMTHGSPKTGQEKADDHPIDLHAATRAGLDYLALGHWHGWRVDDEGRMLMPGTPERDKWSTGDCGYVTLVEIDGPGAQPKVTREPVATLDWWTLEFDCASPGEEMARLDTELASLRDKANEVVLRLRLNGSLGLKASRQVHQWVDEALEPFPLSSREDESTPVLTDAERGNYLQGHPIIEEVWGDLDVLEHKREADQKNGGLTGEEIGPLAASIGLEQADFPPALLSEARRLYLDALREAIKT